MDKERPQNITAVLVDTKISMNLTKDILLLAHYLAMFNECIEVYVPITSSFVSSMFHVLCFM